MFSSFYLFEMFIFLLTTLIISNRLPLEEDEEFSSENFDDVFDKFVELCKDKEKYENDEVLKIICPMYNNVDKAKQTTTSEWIDLGLEILSFLIGLVGVGYFFYLRVLKCKRERQNNIDVDVKIQNI